MRMLRVVENFILIRLPGKKVGNRRESQKVQVKVKVMTGVNSPQNLSLLLPINPCYTVTCQVLLNRPQRC